MNRHLGYSTEFESIHGNDIRRLFVIVMSGVAIAAAGYLSREGLRHFTEDDAPLVFSSELPLGGARIESASLHKPVENEGDAFAGPVQKSRSRRESRELNFARTQIERYQTLASSLTERAEMETDPRLIEKMRTALTTLQDQLVKAEDAAHALREAPKRSARFEKETLRAQLFQLQDSGQKAVAIFVDADNRGSSPKSETYAFSSNRTGQ